MKFRTTAAALAVGLIAGMTWLAPATRADDYPSRTITLIVPFPPGGPSDVVARIIGDGLSRQLNETVIIENVGGAGGTIGTARVAAANKRLVELGGAVPSKAERGPAHLAAVLKADIAKWHPILKAAMAASN